MEKILKEKKYIIVIVVSMISTTLFSYLLFLLFNIGTNSVMGGISGVIFGSFWRNDWWICCNVCFRKDRFKKRKNNKLGGYNEFTRKIQ